MTDKDRIDTQYAKVREIYQRGKTDFRQLAVTGFMRLVAAPFLVCGAIGVGIGVAPVMFGQAGRDTDSMLEGAGYMVLGAALFGIGYGLLHLAARYASRNFSPVNKFWLGVEYFRKGKVERAVNLLTEVIDTAPSIVAAYTVRAWCYLSLEQPQQASRDIQVAIEKHPEWSMNHFTLGNVTRELGRTSDAMWHYERAKNINAELLGEHGPSPAELYKWEMTGPINCRLIDIAYIKQPLLDNAIRGGGPE